MNYKKIWASLVAASTLLLASCSSISEVLSPKKLDTVEGMQQCISYVQEHFADKTVIEVSIEEGDELTSNVGKIGIEYLSEDGKKISVLMARQNGEWKELNNAEMSYNKDYKREGFKGIDLKALSAEKIVSQIQEGIGYTPEKYEYRSVGSYTIKEDYKSSISTKTETSEGKFETTFELHVIEKGKSTEIKGRNIVTTYMGMKFKVEDDGSLSAIED